MKHNKILALAALLLGMAAEGQAQVFQVFQKDGRAPKFQAAAVDSLSHNNAEGLTTIHLKDGKKETFQKAATDSIVWYDPTNSILSTLRQKGNFTNFIQLISDCGNEFPNWRERWTDYLSGATNLTVFAANDEEWKRFFEKNAKLSETDPWHTATSYEALTPDQKGFLLASALTHDRQIREMGKQGILRLKSLISNDVWTPVLTPEYCALWNITGEDQRLICGAPLSAPWMSGTNITAIDVPCTNGYSEEVSTPLTPLATMADIIRNNGKTDIFAHIMDFIQQQPVDPYGGYGTGLRFDPGWAGYYDEVAPEKDMAAMFVPSDEAMWQFFIEGAGQTFLQVYAQPTGEDGSLPYVKPATQEELMQQLDMVSVSVLTTLANTIMMRSFAASVPSNMLKLHDDAMEQLFYAEDVDKIKTCLMGCNGAVYIMDKVYGPMDYTGVTAPAFVSNTNQIMKSAIYGDYMNLNYYAYLKTPQQDITLFLPSDSALFYYYDPISMKSRTPRTIEFYFAGGSFPVKMKFWNYYGPYNTSGPDDELLGTIGNVIPGSSSYSNNEVTDRLKDILYNHSIVSDETQDIHSRNEYYRTFGGDVVKVVRDASGNIIGAKGGFQMENERLGITNDTPGITECKVTQSFESLANGQTYSLAAPLVPTWRSLWSLMTNDQDQAWSGKEGYGGETPYSEFYKLCTADGYETEIIGCGLVDGNLSRAQLRSALKKYEIFTNDNGLDFNFSLLSGNTPYTAFIPTNEAVRKAIAQGLPTWDDIYEDYHNHASGDQLNSFEDSIRISEKIMMLTNTVKAHFCFGMAIADQEPFQRKYKSLFLDKQTLTSPKVDVRCMDGGEMTVTDWNGNTVNVTADKNVFVRDYSCSNSPINAMMRGIQINSHRSGVVHLIDGVLGFTGY